MPEEQTKNSQKFWDEWQKNKEHWVKQHRVYDFAYLQYRSVMTLNAAYGQQYMDAFGMQVYVPLTYQTVESIASILNQQKVEFVVEATSKKDEAKEKYVQRLDNIEWKRSKSDDVRADVHKDALIFGNGYYYNPYIEDKKEYDYLVTPEEKVTAPQDPEDGQEQADEPVEGEKQKWEKRTTILYRGVKPKALDPYYTFFDRHATSDEDAKRAYVYTIMSVDDAKDFVVDNGWMTTEEAEKKIFARSVERFDRVRKMIDFLYTRPLTSWTRGDHIDPMQATPLNTIDSDQDDEVIAFIEMYEPNNYEVWIDGDREAAIYQDHNVYPHKQIPIIPVWDVKVPHVFAGIGEPELIRYQQIETNRVHNLLLDALLMSIVQRYAVKEDLLQDSTDVSFWNPFKPIKLKHLPGLTVQQAIMPMPQPDVKNTPFQIMEMIQRTVQQTTGATDYIVSTSEADTDTATESNNLMSATSVRMKEKTRQMDGYSLPRLVEQWHSIYPMFYTDELDFRIRGEKTFVRYVPYDKKDVNENSKFIAQAKEQLNADGATLEEVYQNAGYTFVLFLSDIRGEFVASVDVKDVDFHALKTIEQYQKAIEAMIMVNDSAAKTGQQFQFDVVKFGKEMVGQFPMIRDVDEYVMPLETRLNMTPGAMPPPEDGMGPVPMGPQDNPQEGANPFAGGLTPEENSAQAPVVEQPLSPAV